MVHKLPVRIYYEDTDAGGVVYHANYLRYAERARSDFLYKAGLTNLGLKERGIGLMIRRAEMEFKASARLEDLIYVYTSIDSLGGASVVMNQIVKKEDLILVEMKIHVVFVDVQKLKPTRLPEDLKTVFEHFIEKDKK